MKKLKHIQQISSFLLLGLFLSAIVFGQNTDSTKYKNVYLINSYELFGKESDIKEVADIRQKIDVEFQPQNEELKKLKDEFQKLAKELIIIREEFTTEGNKGGCFDRDLIVEKIKKVEALDEQIKKYETETLALYEKRENELINPVKKKILGSLQQFAKENNYEVILDLAKLNAIGSFVSVGDDRIDITDQFIKYYNTQFVEK